MLFLRPWIPAISPVVKNVRPTYDNCKTNQITNNSCSISDIVVHFWSKSHQLVHSCCNGYENNEQDAQYRLTYYSKSALHVSGDVFAHHQERLTVFAVSCSVHPRFLDFKLSTMFWMLYAFFWVIPRRLNFICRRFGTLCLFQTVFSNFFLPYFYLTIRDTMTSKLKLINV